MSPSRRASILDRGRPAFLAGLLLLSGFSALTYQMVWLREFRLIFGGATPAAAAVLAVFMGWLGFGAAWVGRRVELTANPLRLYGVLEIGIGAAALASPWLLQAVRALYIQTGGAVQLGLTLAVLLQVALAALVLAVPCLLMGGTLPAAVKVVETDEDQGRGSAGLLYGCNALGALAGVIATNFWLLERLGNRGTLFLAAGVNLLIGLLSLLAARRALASTVSFPVHPADLGRLRGTKHLGHSAPFEVQSDRRPALTDRWEAATKTGGTLLPAPAILAAAFVTGFGFFLIELVWYRMLAPFNGSSPYGFGLILGLALLGIGVGGLFYRIWFGNHPDRVSVGNFAIVAGGQALVLAVPWGLGDRLALLALRLNEWRDAGFTSQIAGWAILTAILVLPASLSAGVQFPLLVGLLGRGATNVGRQIGAAYAWNTAGAITGALVGGFLLLPGLGARACWQITVILGVALVAMALGLGARRRAQSSAEMRAAHAKGQIEIVKHTRGGRTPNVLSKFEFNLASTFSVGALVLILVPLGPTAAWRHSPIGYGLVKKLPDGPNAARQWIHSRRHSVLREWEGRESGVSVLASGSNSLLVNGKSDGSALGDAATQVMLGLIGAALHPNPKSAFVVGLGTGSTAGWLAAVPGMDRVEVVELEPAILAVARDFFGPVNRDVLSGTNVHVIVGDAREVLLTRGPAYDLIFSEPSNPYRAGVASLYTTEFYQAVKRRLTPGGIFSQWLQGYDIDPAALRLVYATLTHVFPHVETWMTLQEDFVFVCYTQTPSYTRTQIESRLAQSPWREAVRNTWLTDSVEGFFAHYIGGPELARRIADRELHVNTDDRNLLEFACARALVMDANSRLEDLMQASLVLRDDVPATLRGTLDLARLQEERISVSSSTLRTVIAPNNLEGAARRRAGAMMSHAMGDMRGVLSNWVGEARSPYQHFMLLDATAEVGKPEDARVHLGWVNQQFPAEARIAAAHVAFRHGAPDGAVAHLVEAFAAVRRSPWLRPNSVQRALNLASDLATRHPEHAEALFEAIKSPFPVGIDEILRRDVLGGASHGKGGFLE